MQEITIIVITLDSKSFVKPCLDSIFSQDGGNSEVIIVDNGSSDGTPEYVKKEYPGVILIENKENLGACKARNQGIEASNGEWILTLDCDTILKEGFFPGMRNVIREVSGRTGMLQPKILKADKKTIYSCGIYLSRLRRFYDVGQGQEDGEEFNESKYVFGACCACAFYNRRMLQELKEGTGYFDERFFFLAEDVDLAWRAQRRNWEGRFCPEAVCYHHGNSSRTSRQMRQYLCFRNRQLSLMKNESTGGRLLSLLVYDAVRFLYLLVTNKYALRALEEIIKNYNTRKYGQVQFPKVTNSNNNVLK